MPIGKERIEATTVEQSRSHGGECILARSMGRGSIAICHIEAIVTSACTFGVNYEKELAWGFDVGCGMPPLAGRIGYSGFACLVVVMIAVMQAVIGSGSKISHRRAVEDARGESIFTTVGNCKIAI